MSNQRNADQIIVKDDRDVDQILAEWEGLLGEEMVSGMDFVATHDKSIRKLGELWNKAERVVDGLTKAGTIFLAKTIRRASGPEDRSRRDIEVGTLELVEKLQAAKEAMSEAFWAWDMLERVKSSGVREGSKPKVVSGVKDEPDEKP